MYWMDLVLILASLACFGAGRILHIKRGHTRLASVSLMPAGHGPNTPCSMMGGFVLANVSENCCSNVQAVTQSTLSTYGLGAKSCLPTWSCDKDGVHPTLQFQQQALTQFCREPGCKESVRSAMFSNWKTTVGAPAVDMLCHQGGEAGPTLADLDGITSAFRMGKTKEEEEEKKEEKKDDEKKEEEGLKCFPGEAIVHTAARGAVKLHTVQPGELVLVEDAGAISFAPILDFLHKMHENGGEYIELVHEQGRVRITKNHIIFVAGPHGRIDKPAGAVHLGEKLLAVVNGTIVASSVIRIRHTIAANGMFAPLTHAGTIVVDGVVASNYALPHMSTKLPHSVAHFTVFPIRMYHALGLNYVMETLCELTSSSNLLPCAASEYHPYVEVIHKKLGIQKALKFI